MAVRRLRLLPPPRNPRDRRRQRLTSRLGWRIAGASIRGSAHRSGSCQDAWYAAKLPGQRFAAAVADGAGSAPHGGIGAAIAVSEAVSSLVRGAKRSREETLCLDHVRAAVQSAADAVTQRAVGQGHPVSAYATTLSVVAGGVDHLVWGQVGDGAVVGSDGPGRFMTVAPPDNGRWINETYFITGGLNRLTVGRLDQPVSAVALITDGLRRLAMRSDQTPFAPFFEPLVAHVRGSRDTDASCRAVHAWLQGPHVAARTADDVTLVVIGRPLGEGTSQ